MLFGVFMFPTEYSIGPVELGRALEERGFESVFFPEHTHIPTSRRSPWPVLFGVGGGWNREEMEHHGTDPARRWLLMRERVAAMKAIWVNDVAEYHGELVDFDPIWQWPKPVQQPHPPVLAHRAVYERFAPQDNQARPDPSGIRQFISGTGGASENFFTGIVAPNSEARAENLGGVLRFTLRPDGYDWQFLDENPDGFTDAGSDTCTPDTSTTTTTAGSSTTTTAPSSTTTTNSTLPSVTTTTTAPIPVQTAGQPGDGPSGPRRSGYWLVDRDGKVSAFGDARSHGDLDPSKLATGEGVTSLSATPSGQGYWFFTDHGRVVPAGGDARFFGDMSAVPLNGPVLDSVATPSGREYYMVASDGGIFAFGDAAFSGSMGGRRLNAPVVSLVPDPDLDGYWLVASDGGVFAFDAPFRGSMGAVELNRPVAGMVAHGDGYLMVGADGGIFNFSDQPFQGSLGDRPPASPVVAAAVLGG